MREKPLEQTDTDFASRRAKARVEVNALDANDIHSKPDRESFFNTVYDRANDDAAQIPWADMAPKTQLLDWLDVNHGDGKTALDIACGLGDNAEALAQHSYSTTAFDLSRSAIEWAKTRFPNSPVHYQSANLFDPPSDWINGFDLVNECYTLQALPPDMLEKTANAIAALVAPGGKLLIYTRMRTTPEKPDGPPWALCEYDVMQFEKLGLILIQDDRFEIIREMGEGKPKRIIPHQFAVWYKTPQQAK